jgi:hypothetical protein
MGTFRACIDEAAAKGDLGAEMADRARRTYDQSHAAASEAFGPAEADRVAADAVIRRMDTDAAEAERRKVLMVRARTAILDGIRDLKRSRGYGDPDVVGPRRQRGGGGRQPPGGYVEDGEVPPGAERALFARGLELLIENKPGLSGAPFPSVEGRYRAIRGRADAMMASLIERFETRTGLDAPHRAELTNVVREAFGEDTGDPAAKALAEAWAEAAEHLRLQFNAAGGSIGRLEGWGLPQSHDAYAVRAAGREQWIADVLPRLDVSSMVDGDTGQPLTAGQVVAALGEVWQSIASLGADARAMGESLGAGALAKRRSDSRFLIFKSADEWVAYQRQYGDGDPFSVMMGHVDELSRDIAEMHILGPNPAAQFSWLKDAAMREALLEEAAGVTGAADRAKGYVRTADNMLEYFRGSLSTPVNSRLATYGASARAYLTSTALGSAILSDIPAAPVFGALARSFSGLSLTGDAGRFAALMAPGRMGVEARKIARRAGFVNEQATDGLLRATQDNLRLLTVGERLDGGLNAFARRLPAAVFRLQGLSAYTAARKRSFRFEFMGALHDRRGQTIADLAAGDAEDRAFADFLTARGFTEDDWATIRQAPAWEPSEGAAFLRPSDVTDESLALRLAEAIEMETRLAVPETTLWTRAKLLGQDRPGTVSGEIRRSWAMFRSFTLTATHLLAEEMSLRGQRAGASPFVASAVGLGGLFVWLTLAGAATIQLREIASGNDPTPMDDGRFWGKAMLQGGGLWLLGDFIFSAEQRGAGQMEAFGPVGGAVGDLYDATIGNVLDVAGDVADGDTLGEAVAEANVGRDVANVLRRYVPGANVWFLRAAWNRALVDQVQRVLDPEAEEEFERKRRKLEREDREQWWVMGSPAPERAPSLAGAGG